MAKAASLAALFLDGILLCRRVTACVNRALQASRASFYSVDWLWSRGRIVKGIASKCGYGARGASQVSVSQIS